MAEVSITVKLARREDAMALRSMVHEAFQDEDLGWEVYKRWWDKNDKCVIVALDHEGRPLGCIDYFPLSFKGDAKLVTGGAEADIDPETDFLGPEGMKTADLIYMSGIVVVQRGTEAGKNVTAALFAGMMRHMHEFYGDRRVIALGIAYSPEGGKLLRRMGGDVLVPGGGRRDGHDLYRASLTPEVQRSLAGIAERRLRSNHVAVSFSV